MRLERAGPNAYHPSMLTHREALGVLGALGLALVGFSVSVDYPRAAAGLWSDEATYITMAHSLAFDYDIRYERRDLERIVREFPGGPSGIFLKRGRSPRLSLSSRFPFLVCDGEPTHDVYYAKAYIYSFAAAPWVRALGMNGLLFFHALCIIAIVGTGYAFLAASSPPAGSAVFTLTFLGASVAPAYFIWLQPELFNFTLVFLGLFFWLYKERRATPPRILSGSTSDAIAAVLLAAAFYSKPVLNAAIFPLLVLLALRRQWRRVVTAGGAFALATAGFFLVNFAVTGDLNYQGGDRKTFLGDYPFQTPDHTFDNTGLAKVTDEVYTQQPWDIVFYDLFFFLFGRFAGMAVYFFPAVVAVVLFALGRREPWQRLLLVTATAECLILIVWMPVNYHGGGGTLGNRYFMNIYPLYFFLIPAAFQVWRSVFISWAVAGVFMLPILVDPFTASRLPGEHATSGPFKWLPVELSLINNLPTNNDPAKFRQPMEGYLAYFLDNHTWGRERHRGLGFWVKGGTEAEMVVRTPIALDTLVVRVLNVNVPNRIRVCVPSGCTTETYGPGEKKELHLGAGSGFPYEDFGVRSYCYLVRIRAEEGEVPKLRRRGEEDNRYLGAFIHVEPEPFPTPDVTRVR